MFNYVFVFFIAVHGLIHLPGFLKAFHLSRFTQLTHDISTSAGIWWLITCLMFFVSAVLYLLNKNYWPFIAIPAIIISQILIFNLWNDAKFGTIANLIILCAAIPAAGSFLFNRMVREEIIEIVSSTKNNSVSVITESEITKLPPIIQKWIHRSGCIGKERVGSVYLEQTGSMRTQPDGNWMPFTAQQHFNPGEPAFLWKTKVKLMPFIYMDGRDKFYKGEGAMLIKLLSLLNVVNDGCHRKINEGSAQRYLAEICWFPSAALSKYISWKQTETNSAIATFNYMGLLVTGLFQFSEEGDLVSFTTDRYYGGGADARPEKWQVKTITYKEFNGIRIPDKSSVTWKLKEGDFNWLNLEVTTVLYNRGR